MPWLKLFPLLLTLLSFLQPLAANASTLLLPLAAVESAAHRDAVSFCRSTAKDGTAHRDALGASLIAVVDGTAVAADYENIGGGIADFGMVAVIGGVKGAGETGAGERLIHFGDKVTAGASTFHSRIKPAILKAAGKFQGKVGNNPDIKIVGGRIQLTGTGPFKGKTFKTDLSATDFFEP